MKKLIIAVDFDNCITMFAPFPKFGKLRIEARAIINLLHSLGHTIIINSCRTGVDRDMAIEFLKHNGVRFDLFNENTPEIIKLHGSDTRKIYADLYIDDKNAGALNWNIIPLIVNKLSRPTILCIVGESGSGKSAVADYIEFSFGIKMIESRTTRPERYAGERGHMFVSDIAFDSYNENDMIAFTKYGEHRYCCLINDVLDLNTYVIDEKGLNYLVRNFSHQFNIYSIRTIASKKTREGRADADRIKRDEGMFSPDVSVFSYTLNTDCSKESTFREVDEIVDDILINKLYSNE